jgi:hypothetical protein
MKSEFALQVGPTARPRPPHLEVETLYTNGPAGGGGVFKSAKDTVAIESTLMSEAFVTPHIQYVETGHEAAPNRSFADWRQRQHIQHLGDRL